MVTALVATVILTPLVYALVSTGEIGLIYVGLALGALTSPAYFAVLAGFLAQAFDARIRYTGISLAYQLSATLIGGMVPFIAQWLLAGSGIAWWRRTTWHSPCSPWRVWSCSPGERELGPPLTRSAQMSASTSRPTVTSLPKSTEHHHHHHDPRSTS